MILLDKESLYYIISQNLYKLNPYMKGISNTENIIINNYKQHFFIRDVQIDEVSPYRIKISKNFKLNKDGIISKKLKLRIKRNLEK
jgi:hypothetical protein